MRCSCLCILGLLVCLPVGCGGGGSSADSAANGRDATATSDPADSPGHQRMIEALQAAAATTPDRNKYLGDLMYRVLSRQLSQESPDTQPELRINRRLALAREALRLGHEQQAIDLLTEAYDIAPSSQTAFELGVAYMRLAETQNCCRLHNAESCIVPFGPNAIHTEPLGAQRAIEWFGAVLAADDADERTRLSARWLYNIAHMTIGQYPHGVPQAHRLPLRAFESQAPFPRFVNVAPAAGLATFGLAGGAVVDDFDGDDDLDILTSSWDPAAPMHYFRNDGDGTFTDRTEAANLEGMIGGLNMVQADYDNDGDLDVFVLRGAWLGADGRHPNSLLRNDGTGRFADVTFDAGLGGVHYPTQTAAWADYDNDGDVDLYVGNETSRPFAAPCQLFRNNGDGTFTDVAEKAGVTNDRFTKGVAWGDIDGDGLPDLCVSNYRGRNRLYRNNGDGTFTDIAERAGVTGPIESFPAWCWDYDNDGALDLFIASYNGSSDGVAAYHLGVAHGREPPGLYRGDGAGGFEQVAQQAGLTYPIYPMGSNFGDLNGDGFLDFYLGTGDPDYHNIIPNLMYISDKGERFVDVTMAGGFGHLQKGHAVAFADLDHDGDLDVFEQMGGAYPGDPFYDALYENPGFDHRFLTVQLVGVASNRAAIGARICVVAREGGAERRIYRHVNSGGSFGANPLRQTIGLGAADAVERVEVFWPRTGRTQVIAEAPLDRFVRITEGRDGFEPIAVKRFRLGGSGGAP